jgi:hypothetical protein
LLWVFVLFAVLQGLAVGAQTTSIPDVYRCEPGGVIVHVPGTEQEFLCLPVNVPVAYASIVVTVEARSEGVVVSFRSAGTLFNATGAEVTFTLQLARLYNNFTAGRLETVASRVTLGLGQSYTVSYNYGGAVGVVYVLSWNTTVVDSRGNRITDRALSGTIAGVALVSNAPTIQGVLGEIELPLELRSIAILMIGLIPLALPLSLMLRGDFRGSGIALLVTSTFYGILALYLVEAHSELLATLTGNQASVDAYRLIPLAISSIMGVTGLLLLILTRQ